jgi:hypothetical protein
MVAHRLFVDVYVSSASFPVVRRRLRDHVVPLYKENDRENTQLPTIATRQGRAATATVVKLGTVSRNRKRMGACTIFFELG